MTDQTDLTYNTQKRELFMTNLYVNRDFFPLSKNEIH